MQSDVPANLKTGALVCRVQETLLASMDIAACIHFQLTLAGTEQENCPE